MGLELLIHDLRPGATGFGEFPAQRLAARLVLGALVVLVAGTARPSAAAQMRGVVLDVVYYGALLITGAVWIVEPVRALATSRGLAWAALLAAVPAVCLSAREVLHTAGAIDGPTLIGVTGLPLGVFASASLVVRYVNAVRAGRG